MNKKIMSGLLVAGGVLAGTAGSIALVAHAQTSPAATIQTAQTTQTAQATVTSSSPTTATPSAKSHHAPLGGDGNVVSVTGTTVVMSEEADEGGASYTVDASKATVTKNGVAATLADITIGNKVFVHGTTNGTNVAATSISIGNPGRGGHGRGGPDVPEASTSTTGSN